MMKKQFVSAFLALLCLAALLGSSCAQATSYPFTAIADKNGAYLRDQPSQDSQVITIVHPNELVTVTGRKGDWYAVRYLGQRGYIHVNKLSYVSRTVFDGEAGPYDEDGAEEEEAVYVRVGKGGANMRDVMDLNAKPVRILHANEKVLVYSVVTVNRHQWAVVRAGDMVGYVSASYLNWDGEDEDDD